MDATLLHATSKMPIAPVPIVAGAEDAAARDIPAAVTSPP